MSETDLVSTEAPAAGTPARRRGLTGMVLAELRQLAEELNISGTSGMRKGDLIAAIRERQDTPATPAAKPAATPAAKPAVTETPQLSLPDDGAETAAPVVETPAAEAPAKPARRRRAASRPAGAPEVKAAETPAVETPAVEIPAAAPPVVETPAVETPAAETPAAETPAAEAPVAEKPAKADRPARTRGRGKAAQVADRTEAPADVAAVAEPVPAEAPAQQTQNGTAQNQNGDAPAEPRRGRSRRNRGGDQGEQPQQPSQTEPFAAADTGDANDAGDDRRGGRTRNRGEDNRPAGRTDNRNDRGGNDRANDRVGERTGNERVGERSDRGGSDRNGNGNDRANERVNDRGGNDRADDRFDDGDDDGDGRGRRGRRFRDRRRGRDRNERGQGTGTGAGVDTEVREGDVLLPVAGIIDVLDNYAFVRTTGYLSGPTDVYVSMSMVRKYGLRRGDAITGAVREQREGEQSRQKFNPLVRVDSINGQEPDKARLRPEFHKLTPLYPNDRLRLETEPHNLTTRVIDLVMPIGKGQRALIVSPPKAGKTTIMQSIANAITTNNPECHLMVVLVDERPEEVTDMQRSVKGEVIASTFDRPPSDHTTVAELSIERAKRLVEMGHDVVVLLDNITRLGRAYNLAAPASGRIMSGGVDSTALYPPKRFLGAARNIEDGGSLTILATALVETGSTMDTVIFEEFKGTGNAELKLDRRIADKRVFPAIDVGDSGTRKEELLMSPDEYGIMVKLRRLLATLDDQQAIDLLLKQLRKTRTNIEFLMQVAKTTPGSSDMLD